MTEIREVQISLSDLEDVRLVLNASLNFFTSRDLSNAQVQLKAFSKSPLTAELERVKDRMDGYLGDFLLSQYEEEHGEISEDEELEEEEAEEEEVEPLSGNPLGTVKENRQTGRRLTKEELQKDTDE